MSQRNIDLFNTKLQEMNWDDVFNISDPQDAFTEFQSRYAKLYSSCFPKKEVKSRYTNRKSWLTDGLKSSIKNKNRLYIKKLKKRDNYTDTVYKAYRNKLTNILRQAEKQHYDDLFVEHKNNLNKTWKTIKEIINKHKNVKISNTFSINNKQVTDPKVIAENFNNFFVNIGPNLANKIPKLIVS